MVNKYSPRQILMYRLGWLIFLWLVVIPLISFGTNMTGMHMAEKVDVFSSFMPTPLAYLYYLIGEIIPDSSISIKYLSGMLLPEFAVYFMCIFAMFIDPPYYDKMKNAKKRTERKVDYDLLRAKVDAELERARRIQQGK